MGFGRFDGFPFAKHPDGSEAFIKTVWRKNKYHESRKVGSNTRIVKPNGEYEDFEGHPKKNGVSKKNGWAVY